MTSLCPNLWIEMSNRPPAQSTELARRQRVERNLQQKTAWQGCLCWGRETGHQGPWAGAAQWAGGSWGALCVSKAGQSFSGYHGTGARLCLRLPSSHQAAGRKGEWLGCAGLLNLPAGHRMRRDSLLPRQFRVWLSRMENQVAWCGRHTGTE